MKVLWTSSPPDKAKYSGSMSTLRDNSVPDCCAHLSSSQHGVAKNAVCALRSSSHKTSSLTSAQLKEVDSVPCPSLWLSEISNIGMTK